MLNKAAIRHMLALYISEKLGYTDVSTYQMRSIDFDHNRHYFGHKAAKDILMLYGNKKLKIKDLKDIFFEGKAIQNYLNDMLLNILLYYLEIEDGFTMNDKDFMNPDNG